MNKKNLKNVIIILIILIIGFYVLFTIYKYSLLKSIQTAIINLNDNNNNYKLDTGSGLTLYYKDGIAKFISNNDKNNWLWTDGKKAYSYMNGVLEDCTDNFNNSTFTYKMKYDENNKSTEELNIFSLAINPFNKVSVVTIKDKDYKDEESKYIRVQYGNEEIVYFNSETKEPEVRFIGNLVIKEPGNYFERNCVTDEDVSISEYLK